MCNRRVFCMSIQIFFLYSHFHCYLAIAATCLREPLSIVITEDIAKRQFGTVDALGKIVMVKNDSTFVPYKVTGCCKTLSAKFIYPI